MSCYCIGQKKGTRLPSANSVISHHQRTILTYEALDRDSNALARGLQKKGVNKGDRVAVSLGNNVEFATVGQPHKARMPGR